MKFGVFGLYHKKN